ncbi:MAG: SPASM domain-containing protein [Candidatus Wallbacteria bacterium]|nr:SPASM domain-containing protein [Candidatus Wallbacteria bacterium]
MDLRKIEILQFGVTDRCNLNCIMCHHGTLEYQRQLKSDFSLDQFHSVLDDMARSGFQSRALYFFWNGESFLHPDFLSMLQYAYSLNAGNRLFDVVYLNTNAGLLDPEKSDLLLSLMNRSGTDVFSILNFSIDAVNEPTYNSIRRCGNFKKTIKNIKYLVRKSKESGFSHPCFVFQIVVQPGNFTEVGDFAAYWSGFLSELGLQHETVAFEDLSYSGILEKNKHLINIRSLLLKGIPDFDRKITGIWQYWKKVLIEGGNPALPELPDNLPYIVPLPELKQEALKELPPQRRFLGGPYLRKNPCPHLFKNVLIRPDGEVTVCCRDPFSLGNLKDSGFSEIWLSAEAGRKRNFDLELDFASLSPGCVHCSENDDNFFEMLHLAEISNYFQNKPPEWIVSFVKTLPENEQKLILEKALFFSESGDQAEALRLYLKLAEKDQAQAGEYLVKAGNLALGLNRVKLALSCYERACACHDDQLVNEMLALLYHKTGDCLKSSRLFLDLYRKYGNQHYLLEFLRILTLNQETAALFQADLTDLDKNTAEIEALFLLFTLNRFLNRTEICSRIADRILRGGGTFHAGECALFLFGHFSDAGNYAEALNSLKKGKKFINPDIFNFQAGEILCQAGKKSQALKYFSRLGAAGLERTLALLESLDRHQEVLEQCRNLDLNQRNWGIVKLYLSSLWKTGKYKEGRELLNTGDFAKNEEYFRLREGFVLKVKECDLFLADCYYAAGYYAAALLKLKKGKNLMEQRIFNYKAGEILDQAGKKRQALKYFQRLGKSELERTLALLDSLGRNQEILEQCRNLDLNQENWGVAKLYLSALWKTGNYREGLQLLNGDFDKNREYYKLQNGFIQKVKECDLLLAECYFAAGDYAAALAKLKKAKTLMDRKIFNYKAGEILDQAGKKRQALKYFRCLGMIGLERTLMLLDELGRDQEVLEQCRALDLNQMNWGIAKLYLSTLWKTGNYREGLQLFQNCNFEKNKEYYRRLGGFALETGEYETALESYSRLESSAKNRKESLEFLETEGYILRKLGRRLPALKKYLQLLKLPGRKIQALKAILCTLIPGKN